ncbi:unnamed protein product [Adineta ricciae]|uniref:Uncharacterized protein n=1 Tax=Adineta ricciae TaxID=249248 RepID=A0A814W7D4_ADIRI|nr:unnamed protein product [Adineta ricciae]CAF1512826.1 unnamed protein product [Adineta ricciae]
MNRSCNNYRFYPVVNKFALILNILAGHNAYEFIRINLPGSLPSATTLKTFNQTINVQINECKFRFDSLKEYLNKTDSNYVFLSEDSTSVISCVSYDATTDCLIGFSPSLLNGIPSINQFKTDSLCELENWFEDLDKSKLINAHVVEPLPNNFSSTVHSRPYILSAYGTNNKYTGMDVFGIDFGRSSVQIIPNVNQKENDHCFITKAASLSSEISIHTLTSIIVLVSEGRLPPYALHIHLFSSQPCEATFRSARALTGTLSTITNFSVLQFMKEACGDEYSLKFPVHHKIRLGEITKYVHNSNTPILKTDDIQKIVMKADLRAESLMNALEISYILE